MRAPRGQGGRGVLQDIVRRLGFTFSTDSVDAPLKRLGL